MYWHDMLTSSETSSPQDVIINAHDPMQNPGQTRIFYKAGQTQLTRMIRMTQPGCNTDLYSAAYCIEHITEA